MTIARLNFRKVADGEAVVEFFDLMSRFEDKTAIACMDGEHDGPAVCVKVGGLCWSFEPSWALAAAVGAVNCMDARSDMPWNYARIRRLASEMQSRAVAWLRVYPELA